MTPDSAATLPDRTIEHLLRELAPQVLGAVAHRHDDVAAAEDAVQAEIANAFLFEMAGDHERAIAHYRAAAQRTMSIPERDYLTTKAARLVAAERTDDQARDA